VTTGGIERRLAGLRIAGSRDRVLYAVLLAATAALYYGGAKLGLALSVANGVITPVWAPTGIALAALVLFGRRLWPAVLVAAFIANATTGASIPVAFFIAIGNTLEAVVGSELLARARFRPSLERVRDVVAFVVLGAALSTAVSATNGVTTLWIAGDLSRSYGSSWVLWWSGDAMGDLLVASLLFVLVSTPWRRVLAPGRRLEAAGLLAALIGLSSFVFLAGYWRYPHLLFPLFILATLRFGQVGAVVSSFVVGATAIAGAVAGDTPLGHASPTHIVQILEGLLAATTISVLFLGAVLAERGEATERLAEAQEVARLGSWQWDIDADRIAWSDELYRLYGLEPQSVDIDFDTFIGLVHPDDRALVQRGVEKASAGGRPFALEHRTVTRDGRMLWLHARGRVVLDANGKAVRMLGTAQDVTDRKQVDELRDTILSAVSHELRTPLTSIVGFALTLKERALDTEMREHLLENLTEQARKLESLLSDLLDLDRLRRGFVRPHFVQTDLAQLVERVVTGHAADIAVRTEPATVAVDPAKVERIVDNLIANAVRHTPVGTKVEVSVVVQDGGVLIGVDDDGPGVASHERASIFEPFRRGSGVGATAGTGVGLSLVAQFVALHDGRVWVEENATGGAGFRVFLPGR
jgi:PAS domain S-box-containing protein